MERRTHMRLILALAGLLLLLPIAGGASLVAWRRWTLHSRSTAYDRLIHQAASRHGLAPCLVKAVIWKESRFRAQCVGRADEVGLMQITEGAVKDWRSARGGPLPTRAMCFDPGLNLEVGTWYLARAMRNWRQYRSADLLALTEYNAGRTCAREAAPANPLVEITEAAVRVRSTQNYIAQVRRKWHDLERAQLPRG